jgi:hypothetical protein
MQDLHYLVPEHIEGIQKNFNHSVCANTVDDAEDWFVSVKERLLDVNKWSKYSGSASPEFTLTDSHCKTLKRHAHKGDYIRIDIPGSGIEKGTEYDWVWVEAIEYDDYPDEDRETIALKLRAAQSPTANMDRETTHLFDNEATSTIVAERSGKTLICHYYGRNETASTDAQPTDAALNSVVRRTWLGFSDLQWSDLIRGLLGS